MEEEVLKTDYRNEREMKFQERVRSKMERGRLKTSGQDECCPLIWCGYASGFTSEMFPAIIEAKFQHVVQEKAFLPL